MPKWTSLLYDDVRNALGDTIVFSSWKGRRYFRSFVIPFNPRTAPQRAHRAHHAASVRQWHWVARDPLAVEAWDLIATPRRISGFNQFISQSRLSQIASPPSATIVAGVGPTVTVTGINPIHVSHSRLFLADTAGVWSDITPPVDGIPAGSFSVSVDLPAVPGTYRFRLADNRALPIGATSPHTKQIFGSSSLNLLDGTITHADTKLL